MWSTDLLAKDICKIRTIAFRQLTCNSRTDEVRTLRSTDFRAFSASGNLPIGFWRSLFVNGLVGGWQLAVALCDAMLRIVKATALLRYRLNRCNHRRLCCYHSRKRSIVPPKADGKEVVPSPPYRCNCSPSGHSPQHEAPQRVQQACELDLRIKRKRQNTMKVNATPFSTLPFPAYRPLSKTLSAHSNSPEDEKEMKRSWIRGPLPSTRIRIMLPQHQFRAEAPDHRCADDYNTFD